ncbi:MAG: dienelactone hydrolase family protein [Cyclobacteriaceae bacterium]
MCLLVFHTYNAYSQSDEQKRKAYLEDIIRLQDKPTSLDSFVSHHDKTWMDWQKRTGELPPDFDALPSIPFLPNLLMMDEGKKNIPVTNLTQWKEQREYFKKQVMHIISGTFPPPPGNVVSKIKGQRTENGVKTELIELRFGKDHQAHLTIEVFTPPGNGPFPVFMTQWNHRGWAQVAVRRGYMGLIYAGADFHDDTQAYLGIYPEYDWTTLMTRAWGAHRAIDYLYTLSNVDKTKIAITGHSRNGKQSLLAAAFDERITAVITSSGGTGGELPYRYTDERQSNESIEFLYSRRTHWGHPRIRFYVGREHKMPIDQTSLLALIAPNALLLSSSIREEDGDPWAIEQGYQSVSSVYEFLKVPEKLGIRLRDGEHAVEARDLEGYMDWLDIQFKRRNLPWENKIFHNYSFDKWKSLSKESIDVKDFPDVITTPELLLSKGKKNINSPNDWNGRKDEILKQIEWILGTEPSGFRAGPITALTAQTDYLASFMNRPVVKSGKKMNIAPYNAMGDYLHASLYYPAGADGKMATKHNGKVPVVIYLHNFSNTGFDSQLSRLFENIVSKGIAVLAFDLVGYGTRIEEGTLFYERYPHWSKLGKMVTDTRGAIDALETLDFVDKEKIFLSGYALGGTVSLFTAALDNRVAGAAVSSAFTPWRDPGNKDQEGLKAYSHLYGLLPRLGFFAGSENKVPVDFAEIASSIAPRPLLIISPELDRHANVAKVSETIQGVKTVYSFLGAHENIQHVTPREFNQLTIYQETDLVNWLDKMSSEKLRR